MKNIPLQGAKNVRDLGGMATADGRRILPHRLLRACHLNAVTDRDVNKLLGEYGLTTVIDLRNSAEKLEKPDVPIAGVHFEEMPVFDSTVPGISHESEQNLNDIPDMRSLYAYVVNSNCMEQLAAIVRRIVRADETDYAILYHCTEGKDRTGLVTALLLTVLGVSRENIMADYLYTNHINRKKAIYYYCLVLLVKHSKTTAGKVHQVFMAKEAYLNELFKVIDRIGQEAFQTEVLQLTDEEIKTFQNRVLTDSLCNFTNSYNG